jgi:hypothetical protein
MSIQTPKLPLLVQVENSCDVRESCRLARDDLRQLARGLLKLHTWGMRANAQIIEQLPPSLT